MKAFKVLDIGQSPALVEISQPSPGAGEILLEIHACGLNFADLLMIDGQYQETPDVPFTLGMEVAGVVVGLGPGAENIAIGDRVAVFSDCGGLAEYGCFAAKHCIKMPENMPFEDAAAFQVAYGTSHLALHHRAQMRAEDTVLVHGAAGGVGLTAVEIAKLAGARVIAVARGKAKLEIARRAGADFLIDSDTDDVRAQVKALGGADIVFDPVGGELLISAIRACNPLARILTIGFASGDIPKIPANIILVKNLTVIGFYWGGYLKFAPDVLADSLKDLMALYRVGKLHPHISHTLPLEHANDALELLRSRKSTGKVVVNVRPRPERDVDGTPGE